ncbi:MAG: restriction endonuclease subunit S [Acetobacter sp.]|uniref:restriction endonuclease subunit S n=1 Tax=Acetobacter sp. TaxID=440 RepID=UPI0039EA571F
MFLKNAVCISLGHSFRGAIQPDGKADTAVVQMRDITPERTIDWTACIRTEIPGRKEPDWLQPGDVLFPTRGSQVYGVTVDATATQQKAVAAPHFHVLRPTRQDLLPEWLAWWLGQAPCLRHFEQNAQSSTQLRNIARTVLETAPLVIPPLTQQKTIVALDHAMQREQHLFERIITQNRQTMTAIADGLASAHTSRIH